MIFQRSTISSFISYMMLGLASIIGGSSLLLFMMFLFLNSLHLVELNLSESTILWLNGSLCLLFFAQHSGMIRRAFRRWLAKIVSPNYHGAFYSLASGVVLLVLVVLWQESSRTLLDFQGAERWFMRVIFFLGIAGTIWGMKALGSFDTFGLVPILAKMHGQRQEPITFIVRGPYRWVRHPLYLFMLLLIWSYPDLTVDRLLFNILFTAWIIAGTMLEERDLVNDFGQVYSDYQRHVPMLIPYRIRPIQKTE
jgi:protein-S-isoprenylcysteine O-methyltransferase Ste14